MDDDDKLDGFDANECVNLINSIISKCCEIRCSMMGICDFFSLHPFIESNATEHSENDDLCEVKDTGEQSVNIGK